MAFYLSSVLREAKINIWLKQFAVRQAGHSEKHSKGWDINLYCEGNVLSGKRNRIY